MLSKLKIVFFVFFCLNLVAVDFYLYRHFSQTPPAPIITTQKCDADCQQKINRLITKHLSQISTTPTPSTPSPTPAKIISDRQVQYFPIPGSGSTSDNKWVNLSGTEFFLSTNDYPNLSQIYFEANLKLLNGNGLAFLRLFDATAGIEVWGSEISTSSQYFTSASSANLTLRPGTRLYRVQAKSLTADTTIFNSGRLKLISD